MLSPASRVYDEPRAISADHLLGAPVTALLVAGIVNPSGPTLTAVVVAAGESTTGKKLPVVQMMLNPFSQELLALGELTFEEKWQPSEDIRRLFDLTSLKSCPSLLLPSVLLDEDRSVRLHAEFLRRFPDSRGVLDLVRQYLGNPWDRVLAEMRADDSIGGETVPLVEDEAAELARLMLSEKHMVPEIQAFFHAWKESLKVVSPRLAAAAMSFETFAGVFEHIATACRLPNLPESRA